LQPQDPEHVSGIKNAKAVDIEQFSSQSPFSTFFQILLQN